MESFVEQSQRRCSVLRKRGRPIGRDRVPMSLDERRARNAEYERERRVEIGDGLAELAAAAGLSDNLSARDLLAEVVNFLRMTLENGHSKEDNAIMRRCNEKLESEITMLEHRLVTECSPRVTTPVQSREQPKTSLPTKRKMDPYELKCPPGKRFSPEGLEELSAASSSDQGYWSSHSEVHQVEQWSCHLPSASGSQLYSSPEWTPQLHSLCRDQGPSVFPMSRHGVHLSPASSYPEAAASGMNVAPYSVCAPVSCFGSTHPNVRRGDLTKMVSIWTAALNVAGGSRLALSQMDPWATEEDLVSLYF